MGGARSSGFEELDNYLQQIAQKASELDGENIVSFDDLFNREFMESYTNFHSIRDFLSKIGINPESEDSFDAFPKEKLDGFVREQSVFSNWNEMESKAAEHWIRRQFDL